MAEVYEMLMKLGLSGGALSDLVIVSDRLTRIHKLTEQITSNFSRWHVLLGGIGTALAGGAILGVMEKIVKKTQDYSEELVTIKRLAPEMRSWVESGEFEKRAFAISKSVPLNVPEIMKIPGLGYDIAGKEEMEKLWEPLARYSALQQSDEKFKGDPGKAIRALLKAGELTGRFVNEQGEFDPVKAQHFLDLVIKIKSATHGMVNEQQILGFAQQAGPTARGLTDKGFMTEAINIQAMSGNRAGTALMSLWQQMAGGTMFKRTAEGLQELGFLKPDEWKTSGGRVILGAEASKRLTRMIGKDPMELSSNISARLDEMGVTDPEERSRMIMRMANRQTTQRMLMEMVVNRKQQRAERERMAQGMEMEGAFDLKNKESVPFNMERVTKAWNNLLYAIGGPQSENIIKALQTITGIINSIGDMVREMDPATLKAVGIGIAGVGAGLLLLGTAAVLGAAIALAPAGAIALAVGTIAGAIGVFAVMEWETFKQAAIAMKDMGVAAAALAVVGWNSIGEGLNTIKTAIVSFIDWTVETSKSLSKRFGDWLTRPLIQNQSYQGSPGGGMQPLPINFNPGQQRQILQPITLSVNLDGHMLGQAVSEILEDMSLHPTGPPDANGWNHFRAMGNQDTT